LEEALPGYMPGFTIVNVPTTNRHIRTRGFDHSQRTASYLAKQTDLPHQTLLARTNNSVQVGKSRAERLESIKGSFRAATAPPKKILLVDDVITTGATLSECARVLKKAGARHVYAVVLAKA
jgi:ComF family protein